MRFFGKNSGKDKGAKKEAPHSRDELKAQALANARAARERLGDETIQKIAEKLGQHNKSAAANARDRVRAMDKDRIASHIRYMIDEEK